MLIRKSVWAALLLCSAALFAQEAGRQKLLAKRAAELDAYRKLAEYVKGLQIDSRTYVRDFVTESDEINAAFRTFIKGAKVTAVRHFDDGTCEVDMEMELERIVTELERIKKRIYKGERWRDVVFENIKKYIQKKTIRVTGSGVVRELVEEKDMADEYISRSPSRRRPWSGMEVWERAHPRDRLMAKRGAETDAYRKLAEYIMGLEIAGRTTVRDFVTESDEVKASFNHFIKGVRITHYTYYPDGTVEAEAEVTIERIVTELERIKKRIYKGERWRDVVFEKITKRTERKIVKAIGVVALGSKYTKKEPKPVERPQPKVEPKSEPKPVEEAVPEWANRTVRATGIGVPPEVAESEEEARLKAERAARMNAQSRLAEKIYGIKIKSETTVRDFVTQSDVVKTEIRKAIIIGAKQVGEPKLNDDGTVEVTLEIDLRKVWRAIAKHIKELEEKEKK